MDLKQLRFRQRLRKQLKPHGLAPLFTGNGCTLVNINTGRQDAIDRNLLMAIIYTQFANGWNNEKRTGRNSP